MGGNGENGREHQVKIKPSMNTPWGFAQHVFDVAAGITSIQTAGHGGILLSPERRAMMPPAIRDIQTFAGGNWYEEDCDSALVALAFPQYFPDYIDLARTIAKARWPQLVRG